MLSSVFGEVRDRVPTVEVARYYGYEPNRAGFISCPFHREKTPSLKLYPNGRWHCFGCGLGGDSLDFVSQLFGITPLEAVKKLNQDFSLGLQLDKPPTPQERCQAQHRAEITQTYKMFMEWRKHMQTQLDSCFRVAHLAIKRLEVPEDFDSLTDAEAMAIKWQPAFEFWSDCLMGADMEAQMEIFRQRREIAALCEKILNSSPPKSKAA